MIFVLFSPTNAKNVHLEVSLATGVMLHGNLHPILKFNNSLFESSEFKARNFSGELFMH